jgi:sulfur-carrier protein adenylyltransferase/sulfurtransferase
MPDQTEYLIPELSAHETGEMLARDEDILLLDVREPHELHWAHLTDRRVRYVPLSQLAQRGVAALPEELREHAGPLIVLCHLGIRSAQVTGWLRQMGWDNVYNMVGGIDAYARQVDPSVGYY